jgi:molybdate transport system permease protein
MMDTAPLLLSAKLAGVSTVLLLILAMPLAAALVFVRFPGRFLADSLVNLPLVLPPTVLGFYLLVLMGPEGPVGRAWARISDGPLVFTFVGITLAAMIHSLPFAVQPLKTAFQKIDPRLLEMSAVLGLTPTATFFRVILPNSFGGMATSAILAFAHTMGEFGVILMIGGSIPGKTRVASIAIYEYVETMRYQEAVYMSLVLVGISYAVLLTVNFLNTRTRHA